MARVLVDGEIRQGYLLNSNHYVKRLKCQQDRFDRLFPLLDFVNLRTAGGIVEGQCVICLGTKNVCNYCVECRNSFICHEDTKEMFIQTMTELVIGADNNHLFKCPVCRSIRSWGDNVKVIGQIQIMI
jgi:hypothetical protein